MCVSVGVVVAVVVAVVIGIGGGGGAGGDGRGGGGGGSGAGVLGGVCAGIGDYVGLDAILVRIMFVLLIVFTGFPLFIYFILWIFIPKDSRAPYRREYREAHKARQTARERHEAPVRTASFRDVKSKFRSLETRMQDLERSITSKEWQLRRDFRDLES